MRVIKENLNRDIFVNSGGKFEYLSDADAVAQLTKTAMETIKGELIYNESAGLDVQNTVWVGTFDLVKFEVTARKQLNSVSGVVRVLSFDANVVDNILSYETLIQTVYGEIQVNGSL